MDVWDLPWGGRARRVSFWKSFEEAPCGFEPGDKKGTVLNVVVVRKLI